MYITMKLIVLILILVVPSWAGAQKFDKDITLTDVSPIFVDIDDASKDGCWTNIKEAKNYAEGQIEITGGKTIETLQGANSTFFITVVSTRNNIGCYGNMTISVERPAYYEGHLVYVLFSEIAQIATGQKNFNSIALDEIKRAVSEWR